MTAVLIRLGHSAKVPLPAYGQDSAFQKANRYHEDDIRKTEAVDTSRDVVSFGFGSFDLLATIESSRLV